MSWYLTRPRESLTFRANRSNAATFGSTAVPSRLSRIWSALRPTILPMAECAARQ